MQKRVVLCYSAIGSVVTIIKSYGVCMRIDELWVQLKDIEKKEVEQDIN